MPVDRGVLAEYVARPQVAKAHNLACERVDEGADLPGDEEIHVIGAIEVFDDRLTRLVAPPATALLNMLQGFGGEALQ